MTQELELLLKDLCGRLPYGVKGTNAHGMIVNLDHPTDYSPYMSIKNAVLKHDWKPYLFPMSSMTEEQYNSLYESGILDNCSHNYEYVNPHIYGVSFIFKQFKTYSLELIEWLNKNYFDYRGLISMGLAIDCTNLNIY